jgi:SCP-2 sterol transfer family
MMWTMRQRTDMEALPDHRVVIRFEFSHVPANRTRLRIMWLVLDRSGVDVCAKDPGFPVDITLRGDVVVFVRIYLGQTTWEEAMGKAVAIEGNARLAQRISEWIKLRQVPRPQSRSARPAA